MPSPSSSSSSGGQPSSPSLPSAPSSSSGQSSSGGSQFPQIPGLPDPGQRSGQSGSDQAQDGQQNGESASGSESGQVGQVPTGGPQRTRGVPDASGRDSSDQSGGQVPQRSGDEELDGSQSGAQEGEDLMGTPSAGRGGEEDGQTMESGGSPGEGIFGTEDGEDNEAGGWEVSNQLPEAERTRAGSSGELSEEEEELGSNGDDAVDAEMAKVLGEIDGSIMEDRAEQGDRENERAGGPMLPGQDVVVAAAGTDDGSDDSKAGTVGGTSTDAIPNATDPHRRSSGIPNSPPTPVGVDTADARDDDVIARQLREAAIAETDPELREKLWEEYRRYTDKRK